ncbi:MAG: type II and III secretion system protein, partial [Omnitrophica bacterium]|nr:type II and III secretion system protein [Candidatus Omnitrophota bacterium]
LGAGGAGTTAVSGTADFMTERGANVAFPFVGADQFAYGTLDFSQFTAVLEYLKSRADTDIISNPRITTLNNKPAKMFVGKVYNYISEVEQQDDTAGARRWTYHIEKEEIGIRLLVTPHINSVGDIEVELQPEIKDVIGFQQVTEFFSLPIFTTREAETQVIVKDRQTIFIGGLIKESVKKSTTKFPILGDFLGDVPLIGFFFKHKTEIKEKTELVIFLTVHVVKDLDEFNRFAARGISDVKMPFGTEKNVFSSEASSANEVFVELPGASAPKQPYKPIFNLRKDRKGKSKKAVKPRAAR